MKVKSENTKLIIWALVALVIGVVIGMYIMPLITGNAKAGLQNTSTIEYNDTARNCGCTNSEGRLVLEIQ